MSGWIGDVISSFGAWGMAAFMVLLLAVALVAVVVSAGRGAAP